jgi:glycosyltransferase involved in cell wall biosynthesis
MAVRAREMASRLRADYEIQIVYRRRQKLFSILTTLIALRDIRPAITYVFDISYSAVLGAAIYRFIFRNRLIIETGDAITELVRSTGSRRRPGVWLTGVLEKFAMRFADRVVVRGSFHKKWLSQQGIDADVIPDGVDTCLFRPHDGRQLRCRYGLDGMLTIGMIGSSVWSEKLQMSYGWDLVEALRLLKHQPVKGVMIGDGSGIPHLKALCRQYGIDEKLLFLGHVPYEQLADYLSLIDICLSTQTNDVVGQVRTTGKLPLYLASGRYVLASKVGEAAIVLDQDMLVDYHGVKDVDYPRRLSERIESILQKPEVLARGLGNQSLAKEFFDYEVLAKRLGAVIAATLKPANS